MKVVIEKTDSFRGTLKELIDRGTLKPGDAFVNESQGSQVLVLVDASKGAQYIHEQAEAAKFSVWVFAPHNSGVFTIRNDVAARKLEAATFTAQDEA